MRKFSRKKLLSVLTALTALTFGGCAVAGGGIATNFEGCTPDRTIFFAQHRTHDKAVEICKVKGGYRYTNGPLGHPSISIIKSGSNVRRIATDPGSGFLVRNGGYSYWLRQDAYGNKYLMATRGYPATGKTPLANIALDSEGWGYKNNSYRLPE